MKKTRLICFRATSEMYESLTKVAKEEHRSLSLTIELAVTQFLKEKKALRAVGKERRQFPRKAVSLPAFVKRLDDDEQQQLFSAAVTDISLGGVKIAVPKNTHCEISVDREGAKFRVIFQLPDTEMPVSIECEAKNIVDSVNSLIIGAAFTDAEFNSYKTLQSYLI